jgi:tRNA (guanine10-N2)-dimethyltransferase
VEQELCELETQSLFGIPFIEKGLLSDKRYDPSISPFLRSRIRILYRGQSSAELIRRMEAAPLVMKDFRIDYLRIQEEEPDFDDRFALLSELGMAIQGEPDLKSPGTTLAVTCYQGEWLFGEVVHNRADWQKHAQKPHPYSNSLGIKLAKALVNIAAQGDFSCRIVDPCCGAGTVLLEGLYAGYDLEGFDINKKVSWDARKNLEYFGFPQKAQCRDIAEISQTYDAAIVDLPYGLFTVIKDHTQSHIIREAARIASRVIFVAHENLEETLKQEGFTILKRCRLAKRRVAAIVRHIWVCFQGPRGGQNGWTN